MFLARWPSFLEAPISSTAPRVSVVIATGRTTYSARLSVLQRVGLVADLGEVALGELVGVGDHQPAARQVVDVGLQRRRVHRDEDVGTVAGGQDVVVGDLDLERRDAGQRALWRADLGGVIRLCRKVIAEQGGLGGEPVTGELHAVTGVTGESDDDLFEFLSVTRSSVAVRTHVPAFRRFVCSRFRVAALRRADGVGQPRSIAVTRSTDYCTFLGKLYRRWALTRRDRLNKGTAHRHDPTTSETKVCHSSPLENDIL